jgi:hypothetical protein
MSLQFSNWQTIHQSGQAIVRRRVLSQVVFLVGAPVHLMAEIDMTMDDIQGEKKNFPAHAASASKIKQCCVSAMGFNANPDPAFYLNVDPDPNLDQRIQTNANPCGSGS